jgi:hypothetical protein
LTKFKSFLASSIFSGKQSIDNAKTIIDQLLIDLKESQNNHLKKAISQLKPFESI